MNYKELDVLTLSDNNEYVIADICEYQNKKYAYLVDINNKGNIIYAELKSDDVITAIGSEHSELIKELNKIIASDIDRIRNIVDNFENEK